MSERKTKKRHAATRRNADRVFELLSDAGPSGMSSKDIRNVTGMSQRQLELSIQVIKETLAGLHDQPIIYDATLNRYKLDADEAEIEEYHSMRARQHLVQLKHLLTGTIEPAMASLGDTMFLRLARRSLSRLVEDLEDIAA